MAQAQPVVSLVRPLCIEDPDSVAFMLRDLERSGLLPHDIAAYPIQKQGMGVVPAYCIPYHDERMYRIRYDRDIDKYTQPKNLRDVWWPPRIDLQSYRSATTIFIIEGEKKAAKFHKQWPGLAVFGIGGCHNALIKNDGAKRLLDPILSVLRPSPRGGR